MATDYPYVYPRSREQARYHRELELYEDSFRLNIQCAKSIERAIQDFTSKTGAGTAKNSIQPILDQYGFKRVNLVLSTSVKKMSNPNRIPEDIHQWARGISTPLDGKWNRRYAVNADPSLLCEFIEQARQAYCALGLFGSEHCMDTGQEPDYTGKVLVLSPGALRESHWSPRDQLWLATGGAGCMADKLGSTVFAVCLSDGESTRWTRSNFIGVLDEQFLPDWAAEKLAELRGSHEIQPESPSGGMEMK